MTGSGRLERALAAIDAANRADPNEVTVRDRTGPKEVIHAELVTDWVRHLRPDADEALLLAARGHHFRRWTIPRNSFPGGRAAYLRWRRTLHKQQADELGALLRECGYDEPAITRVQALVRKDGLGRDPDVQTLEDALCLVFLETQFLDVAARLEPETLRNVVVKTAAKMSRDGMAAIADVPLDPRARELLDGALAADVVGRYLDALREHDWDKVASTLAADVERIGPYRDVYRGRDEYARFLQSTIAALPGYELVVDRITPAGGTVLVELQETVDDDGARLRTHEAVVFDVDAGEIARVAVYLQSSERIAIDSID
jgi:ketosteroid isomerase-like protein